MDQIKYKALIYTVELGGLTKAAEVLGYTQSGISHMISSLEKDCGVQLLYRDRAGVQLTSAGQQLLPYFQAVCSSQHQLDMMLKGILGEQTGLLRIASHTSIAAQWLPGIFDTFQTLYPYVNFELREVVTNDETRKLLRRGSVDCGFTDAPCADKDLDQVHLHKDALVAVVSLDHELANAEYFPLDALDAYPYIKLEETPGTANEFTQLVDKIFISHGKIPHIKFSVRDEYTVMAMVSNHHGFSILPQMMTWGKKNSQLACLPLETHYYRNIYFVTTQWMKNALLIPQFRECAQSWVAAKYPLNSLSNPEDKLHTT